MNNKTIMWIVGGVVLAVVVAAIARAQRYGVPVGSEQYDLLYAQEKGLWV